MKIETEQHSGICGHCKTDVPLDAEVCTGCGARWALSNGLSRQQQYDTFIGRYKVSKFAFYISILIMLTFYYTPPGFFGEAVLAVPVVGVIIFLASLNGILGGKTQIDAAKNGDVSWWRS